tara:strand:- start:665 stop:1936 length:1272 start_codon:yes stop_codon:yes gene_type:complete
MKILLIYLLVLLSLFNPLENYSQVNSVHIEKNKDGFQLFKNNQPYYIKGAGAKSHFNEVKNAGANSIRVWSTNNKNYLDSAHKYGLTVTLGLWVAQERNGFNYDDEYAVAGQIALLKKHILKLKDHPALLMWGIGNEVDLKYSNFKVWETIEEIAKFIKKVDPNHPTMTVIAGIDPSKLFMINKYCPSIDVLGINVYGAIEQAHLNVRKYNWEKPYIVTEWGVNGPFEAQKTSWGAKKEPPNGLKADQRLRRYKELIEPDKERCLGSYCFLWGQKQESTATWHGMYLNSGNPTEAVDVMHYCWKGQWPIKRAPSITDIKLNDLNWRLDHFLKKDTVASLSFDFNKYNNTNIQIDYILYPEAFSNKMGGDFQESPDPIYLDIIEEKVNQIIFKVPSKKGAYRIFTFIKNEYGQSSVANIPFLVN